MKLFINAANLRFGGGKTVGLNIINYYIQQPGIEHIVIIAPVDCGYDRFQGQDKVELLFLPKLFNISVFKIVSNYLLFPILLLLHKADFVLSLGNVAIPTRKPQFLLIHQPFLAYPESIIWQRIRKDDKKFFLYITNMVRFIKANLRFASVVGVQTEAMKARIHRLYHIPLNKIYVIPNAISFTSQAVAITDPVAQRQGINLLFLSKYYPHKNFEVLYEVGKSIAARQLPLKISVTIDANENEGSRKFLEMIHTLQLDQYIVNLGNISLEDIPAVYARHDGLFLPTFLESFSGTYIESMHFSKPIFTSDMDFAREVCKEAAYYFDPVDQENIINTILSAFEEPSEMQLKVEKGKELMMQSKSWNDIGKYIDSHILNLN